MTSEPSAPLPAAIGEYRVLGVLGEGGMGIVYEAEQRNPRRPVALKVIRGGRYVDEATVRMFRREAQTLARLKHPSIAAIYESGRTEDGCHFFAMELVRGDTLTEYARASGAGPVTPAQLRRRIDLFRQICDAVHYAHQRGVIHRDLKPSNILVLRDPERESGAGSGPRAPEVKILDFGLARITDRDLEITGSITGAGVVRGTLPYMSPEQIRGNSEEVDVRADVYALGVVFYELLSGKLPYDLEDAPLHDVVRTICETAPRPLSRSWSGSRRLDPDLETIVLKTLEKEPSRRYPSAAALSEDLDRYLTNQPILARPPSAAYQIRKLVSRHRVAFAFATALAVLVVAFGAAMGVLAGRIAHERDRANREADTARRVSGFLQEVFAVSDPDESVGSRVTARELLDRGAASLDADQGIESGVRASLHQTIGSAYRSLGILDPSEKNLAESLRLREVDPGPDRLDLAAALVAMADLLADRNRFPEAEPMYRRALEIREKARGPDAPLVAATLNDWGYGLLKAQRPEDAEAPLKRALTILDRPGGDPKEAAKTLANLALLEQLRGRVEDGLGYAERAAAVEEKLYGREHPLVADALAQVAELQRMKGDYVRAEEILVRANAVREKTVGPEHPRYALGLTALGNLFYQTGRWAEAEPLHRRALEIREKVYGPEHSETANSLNNLSVVIGRMDRFEEAEALQRRALAIQEKVLGPETGEVAYSLNNLGNLLVRQNKLDQARPFLDRALAVRTKVYGERSNEVAQTLNNMGNLAMRAKRYDEADVLYARALAIRERLFGPDNTAVAAVLDNVAKMRRVQGRAAEADALDARSKAIREKASAR